LGLVNLGNWYGGKVLRSDLCILGWGIGGGGLRESGNYGHALLGLW